MRCKNTACLLVAGAVLGFGSSWANEPLRIDAGEDRTASLGGLVSLAGSANKDASIGWTKIEGPGEVIFQEPHSATSTASFSEPGDYVLMLGGYDGDIAYDTVRIMVNR